MGHYVKHMIVPASAEPTLVEITASHPIDAVVTCYEGCAPYICDGLKPPNLFVFGNRKEFLEPRAFKLLDLLFRRPERRASFGDAVQEVWTGVAPTDAAFRQTVRRVRVALAMVGFPPTIIYRDGYVWLGFDDVDRSCPHCKEAIW